MVGTGVGGGGTGEAPSASATSGRSERAAASDRQRLGLRPRRRRAGRPARAGARRDPGRRQRPRTARQGDHPPHHPAPHQRGEVLLRAGADEASRASAAGSWCSSRSAASGQVIASVLQNSTLGNGARRELHCPGRPSLGVPVAARRRHRHRVVSLRADAQGRRERGTRHRPRSARRVVARPIVQALATLTRGRGRRPHRAHLVAARAAPGFQRRGAGVDHQPAGRRFRDAPARRAPARAQQAPPRRGPGADRIDARRARRHHRRAGTDGRRCRRGRAAEARRSDDVVALPTFRRLHAS